MILITLSGDLKKGQFEARDNGNMAGILTFTQQETKQITIHHTEVNPQFKGKGVGKSLFMEAVGFARKNDLKIYPECTFAQSMFEKLDEVKDVVVNQ
jgi:hypothetical protein